MKPLREFFLSWFAEVEQSEQKRAAAVRECLVELRTLSRKHPAPVLHLACLKYLGLDGDE